jgi:hypothetical protein
MPFPHHQPRCVPSFPVPLTCVLVTCAAHSLAARPPIVAGHATDPAMAAGAYMSWRLRSSLAAPRAPTSVASAGGARVLPLAVGSHLDRRNRPARPSPLLCCKYMFQVFQMFQTYVAIVTDGCWKSRSRFLMFDREHLWVLWVDSLVARTILNHKVLAAGPLSGLF